MHCIVTDCVSDPLRPEVPDAVRKCQLAGITVRMVTGDNISTAKKIAAQCGIYTPESGGVAIEGVEFARLSKMELDRILPKLQVLARSSPTDKFKLVRRLRQLNQIVAVTVCDTDQKTSHCSSLFLLHLLSPLPFTCLAFLPFFFLLVSSLSFFCSPSLSPFPLSFPSCLLHAHVSL